MLPLFFVGIVIVVIAAIVSRMWKSIYPEFFELERRHVMITGGSSGIGKAIAVEALKRGASVTIVARNQEKLDEAKIELSENCEFIWQQCHTLSMDICDSAENIHKTIQEHVSKHGEVDMLVNCAGASTSGSFEDIPSSEFKRMMELNYLGAVHVTKAVVGPMKSKGEGRIVIVSSTAGQLGVFGYSAYSPSKYAQRGLAECLQMELKPYNIRVTLAFPPDTDTPGFKMDKETEPKETRLIGETAGLFTPEYVAECVIRDAENGKFLSSMGFDGQLLTILTCGMTPVTSFSEALTQVVYLGILRIVSLYYLAKFDGIILRCKQEREEKVKSS